MGVIHRLGVKVRAGAKHVWGNKVKIATAIGGAVALGKKLTDHKDAIHSLHSDVVEAQHTAQEVKKHTEDVSGVRSAVGTAKAVKTEISEAKEYRDTRRDAIKQGIQMDPRPVHQPKHQQIHRHSILMMRVMLRKLAVWPKRHNYPRKNARRL